MSLTRHNNSSRASVVAERPALNTKRNITSIMSVELDTISPFRGQSLVGQKFGKLTIKSFVGIKKNPIRGSTYFWNCLCECGSATTVSRNNLTSGKVRSCGCLKGAPIIHGHAFRGNKHHLYETWLGLRQRCNNPKKREYHRYGGRGIKVDPRWDSFVSFLADMESTWKPGLSINRKDNDGPYSPENCEWATQHEQMNNMSGNRPLTFNGETLNIGQWCSKLGLKMVLILNRLDKLGWTVEKALTTPPRKMTFK